jgi:hypothetical protein
MSEASLFSGKREVQLCVSLGNLGRDELYLADRSLSRVHIEVDTGYYLPHHVEALGAASW